MQRARALFALLVVSAGLGADPVRAVPPRPGLAGKPSMHIELNAALRQGLDEPAALRARLPERVLVLLVDFADRPHATNLTPAAIDSMFFGRLDPSLRRFYENSSFGRLHLTGTVTPWLRLPESYAFYADAARSGAGVRGAYPRNARRMVEDALRSADQWVDFRAFDTDGPDGMPASGDDDGLVDALVVVHAGDGAEYGDARQILSHNWFTTAPVETAEHIRAWRYATVAETSPIGVVAHEFGHQLGLRDLYDRRSTTGLGGGLGDWSLMASGPWLDDGQTPADLDAASKVELGFVDAVAPADNGSFALGARAPGRLPDVYRVWTHGVAANEFLVIENRQPSGQDAFLPGGGMLVYHVDLRQPNNDDDVRPRVELLQADGRTDIENRINNGDAGDPFPGTRTEIGPGTSPSTRARDGSDSQVRIFAISAPTPNQTFGLEVESEPEIVVESSALVEVRGDGNGAVDPAEDFRLVVRLRNDGVAQAPALLRVQAHPYFDVNWGADTVPLPALATHDTARAVFFGTVRAFPLTPYGLDLRLTTPGGAWRDSVSIVAVVGAGDGFQACFKPQASSLTRDCHDPAASWDVVQIGGAGTWTAATRTGEFGWVFRSADGARYANNADAALVSPPFRLAAGSELRLLHAFDTEDVAAGFCADGGRVELSIDAGPWTPITPAGGYPRRMWLESVAAWADQGVFGGASPRRWDSFDLGAQTGIAALRFHFASGDSIGGAGWEIARVEVGPRRETLRPRLEIVAEPNPVRFPTRIAFRINARLTWAARPTTLMVFDVRGRRIRTLQHAPVPAESGFAVWDGTDSAGHAVASGLYVVCLDWGGLRATHKLVVAR